MVSQNDKQHSNKRNYSSLIKPEETTFDVVKACSYSFLQISLILHAILYVSSHLIEFQSTRKS